MTEGARAVGELRERAGRRFARLATNAVVARPGLWRLFRAPLRRQFEGLAAGWETRRGPEALAPLVAALDRVPAPASVLDLGTGTGKAARLAAERFPDARVVGVDLSPAMIEEALRLLTDELRPRVRLEVADASALPFRDGEFDLIILLNMIPFFSEVARITAPGGAVVLAFSSGAATPIYVAPETLRGHFGPLGFGDFEEVAVGEGTSFVARKLVPKRGIPERGQPV